MQAVALSVDPSIRVGPEADALQALHRMLRAGRGRLLVFEGETFRGLLTHTAVARLSEMKKALAA